MYCEGGRSRTGKLAEQPKRGIGRLALKSGATVVPVAIHGSSHVRNWKRLQFPKVTVLYGDPIRWEQVEDPTREQQQQVGERDLRRDPRALRGAGHARPPGPRAAPARVAPRRAPQAPRPRVVELLRAGLLEGAEVLVTGDGDLAAPVRERLYALGAEEGRGVLVVDASAPPAGGDGVRAALDGAWDAIRPVANEAMIPAGRGLIVLLAPRPGDAHAAAARAGLENLARTLSVEWARFQVRTVAVLPGATEAVTELVAYLASPAGAYFSGCAFELA